MSPKVQDFATGLVKNVYGRIMPARSAQADAPALSAPQLTMEDLAARLEELPTRDELVTAFSVLQAELDRQHMRTRKLIVGGLAVHFLVLAAVTGIVVGLS